MTLLNAIILGLVQGIAEFLPISSSGHLVIFQSLLGLPDTHNYVTFDVLLHFGTLISVAIFYYKDIWELIKAFFGLIADLFRGKFNINKNEHTRLLAMLVIATVPLVLALIFNDQVSALFTSTLFVGIALLVTGTFLFFIDRMPEGRPLKAGKCYKQSFLVGLCQLFAVVPGISRSGSTIFGGRLVGFKKEFAVKFSLLLSMIAVLGATVVSIPDMFNPASMPVSPLIALVGVAVSAVSGVFAIKFLVKMLNKGKFKIFSYYCWAVGLVTIIMSIIEGV